MAERERSTESHLLEDVQRRPERYPELLKQIEQVVLGECREAHLRTRQTTAPYEPAMMIMHRSKAASLFDHLVGGDQHLVGAREQLVWTPAEPCAV